jgi:AraC-like DNA-binding protein
MKQRTVARKSSARRPGKILSNSSRGAMIARRETSFLPDGTYVFEDQLDIQGPMTARVVTCTGWLLESYQLEAGELFFLSGKTEIRPKGKYFGVFYPPFTIARPCFVHAKGTLLGLAGTKPLPAGIPIVPFIFESTRPLQTKSVTKILEAAQNRQSVDANPNASSLSIKAKRLISEGRSNGPSIGRIAARLRVSNEHLSRQFRRDYGMSPREYLHQLRIADAPLRLARGEEIVDVAHDSGYGDLSRFYKQFRKTTKTSPGFCRKIVAPNRGQ